MDDWTCKQTLIKNPKFGIHIRELLIIDNVCGYVIDGWMNDIYRMK
jgi:hypothetical protein